MTSLVEAARRGDLAAFGALVERTQAMAHAVAWQWLGPHGDTRDAVQEAYLRAFRRLADLDDPEAFAGWIRRIVVTVAHNHRRGARGVWLPLGDGDGPPVLDDDEQMWTPDQFRKLARALLSLEPDERRLCERHYHGRWSAERMAEDAGIEPAAMRKRLQRIRQKLRKEIEMEEQRILETHPLPRDLPGSIVELLARPRLVDLPDNPVGAVLAELLAAFPGFLVKELPEIIDLDAATNALGGDAVYIDRAKLHTIEGAKILRYDLTLPLLLEMRAAPGPLAAAHETGSPLRLTAAGSATGAKWRAPRTSKRSTSSKSSRRTIAAIWTCGGLRAASSMRCTACSPVRKSALPRRPTRCAHRPSASTSAKTTNGSKSSPGANTPTGSCAASVLTLRAIGLSARGWGSSDWRSSATGSTTCAKSRSRASRRAHDRARPRPAPLGSYFLVDA